MMKPLFLLPLAALAISTFTSFAVDPNAQWVTYEGKDGPGKGKKIVLVSGDEEYRSEESMPQLGKILAERHGFTCTVVFALDPDGTINPENGNNIPGLEALDDADMMIIATRFRELPDDQMKHIDDFLKSGKAIMGLRTATHAFNYTKNKTSPYAHYSFNDGKWKGGFGQQVLGDTWINHHGNHKVESTRGLINFTARKHPILQGCEDVWGPTDVYGVRNLPDDALVLLWGQVLEGMKPDDKAVDGAKNNPMMPIAWVREYASDNAKQTKVFCTTMGSSTDLESEGFRRLLVNGVYWAVGMGEKIGERTEVGLIGEFKPLPYGFGGYAKGVKPAAHALP